MIKALLKVYSLCKYIYIPIIPSTQQQETDIIKDKKSAKKFDINDIPASCIGNSSQTVFSVNYRFKKPECYIMHNIMLVMLRITLTIPLLISKKIS